MTCVYDTVDPVFPRFDLRPDAKRLPSESFVHTAEWQVRLHHVADMLYPDDGMRQLTPTLGVMVLVNTLLQRLAVSRSSVVRAFAAAASQSFVFRYPMVVRTNEICYFAKQNKRGRYRPPKKVVPLQPYTFCFLLLRILMTPILRYPGAAQRSTQGYRPGCEIQGFKGFWDCDEIPGSILTLDYDHTDGHYYQTREFYAMRRFPVPLWKEFCDRVAPLFQPFAAHAWLNPETQRTTPRIAARNWQGGRTWLQKCEVPLRLIHAIEELVEVLPRHVFDTANPENNGSTFHSDVAAELSRLADERANYFMLGLAQRRSLRDLAEDWDTAAEQLYSVCSHAATTHQVAPSIAILNTAVITRPGVVQGKEIPGAGTVASETEQQSN